MSGCLEAPFPRDRCLTRRWATGGDSPSQPWPRLVPSCHHPTVPDSRKPVYSQTHPPLLVPAEDKLRKDFTVKYTLFFTDVYVTQENSQEGCLLSSMVLRRAFSGEAGTAKGQKCHKAWCVVDHHRQRGQGCLGLP